MSCFANQMAKSEIGKLDITAEKFNKMFGVKGYLLNTYTVGQYIKIFKEKLGNDELLTADVQFKDVKVAFGKYEVDVIIDYTMCFAIKTAKFNTKHKEEGMKELMYDCIVMNTAMDVRSSNNHLHIKLIDHKVNLDTDGANRDAPKRDTMGLTVNEYREFIEDFSTATSVFKNWLNNFVLTGDNILFPYSIGEYDTTLKFED